MNWLKKEEIILNLLFENLHLANQNHTMNLHEYQGKQILSGYGVGIRGEVASSPEEVPNVVKKLGEETGTEWFVVPKYMPGDEEKELLRKLVPMEWSG